MKTSAWLLLASLGANAALLGLIASREPAAVPAAAPRVPVAPVAKAPELPGREFLTLTPEQLRDRLRALGLPANVVAQLVSARINARVEARTRELVALAMKSAPPWRFAKLSTDRLGFLTAAQRKEVRELEAEARDATLRLLGPDYADPTGRIAFKYGFVLPDKALLLDAIDTDYENLRAAQKDDARYLKLAGDQEREKFLRTEQDRDLAALLTPAEREAYELRASPAAQNSGFRAQVAAVGASEAEYRALFALQRAAEDSPEGARGAARFAPMTGAAMMSINSDGRELPPEAVRVALGDARFADWQLAGQPYFQSLAQVVANQNLPEQTARELGGAITQALEASWRTADDTALTPEQKRATLAELANGVQTQLTARLGAGPAAAFLSSQRWFDSLNNGTAVLVRGNTTGFRPVDATRARVTAGSRPGTE